jgi:hypothetical protein
MTHWYLLVGRAPVLTGVYTWKVGLGGTGGDSPHLAKSYFTISEKLHHNIISDSTPFDEI